MIPDMVTYGCGGSMLLVAMLWLIIFHGLGGTEIRAVEEVHPYQEEVWKPEVRQPVEEEPAAPQDFANQRPELQDGRADDFHFKSRDSAIDEGQAPAELKRGWNWLMRRRLNSLEFADSASICLADTNGNGEAEIIVLNQQRMLLSWINPTSWQVYGSISPQRGQDGRARLLYGWDPDGDGRDLLVLDHPSGGFTVDNAGIARQLRPACHPLLNWPPADFDGDGLEDLLCLDESRTGYVLLGSERQVISGNAELRQGRSLSFRGFGDVDGDGLAEVLEWDQQAISLVSLGFGQSITGLGLPDRELLAAFDISGDACSDLIWTGGWTDSVLGGETAFKLNWSRDMDGCQVEPYRPPGTLRPFMLVTPGGYGNDHGMRVFDAAGNERAGSRPVGTIQGSVVLDTEQGQQCIVLTNEGIMLWMP